MKNNYHDLEDIFRELEGKVLKQEFAEYGNLDFMKLFWGFAKFSRVKQYIDAL